MKTGTVALAIRWEQDSPILVEAFSDEQEIHILDSAARKGETDVVSTVKLWREQQKTEEDEFGDYVEELLTQPFLAEDVRKHGLQWFKSKAKIEKFQRNENDATLVIAEFAMKVFTENPQCSDFFLVGPTAKVRVRVFSLGAEKKLEHESEKKRVA